MDTQSIIEQADRLFEPFAKPDVPGCAVALLKDGETVYKQGYGSANLEHGVPINPATRFNIGSESKQFTALAILLLAKDGKLTLDDDIRKHLDDAPDFGDTITIRHLLHHTSGVRCSFPPLLMLSGWRESDITTHDEVYRLFARQRELNFKPGDEYSYANMGYVLLATIVQRVSGTGFAAFCTKNIFEPLGMTSTVIHDNPWLVVPHRAQSYWENDGAWFNATLCDSVLGPTNVYTTVEDLARWDENFYTGKVGGMDVLEQMLQRGVLNDGTVLDAACGLQHGTYKGLDIVEHGGQHGGYTAQIVRFPSEHATSIVLFNRFTFETRRYAIELADILLGDRLRAQPSQEENVPATLDIKLVTLREDQLQAKAGKYFNARRAALREVVLRKGKLSWKGQFDMLPVDENTFALKGMTHYRIVFSGDTDGVPVRVQFIDGKTIHDYDRVAPAPPSTGALKEYTGRYYSPELDLTWTIALEDAQLVVKRQRYVDTPLASVFRDGFTDDWSKIADFPMIYFWKFDRTDDGAISGFAVSDDRMRNLKFTVLP